MDAIVPTYMYIQYVTNELNLCLVVVYDHENWVGGEGGGVEASKVGG